MRVWKWIAAAVVLAFLLASVASGVRHWSVEPLPASAYFLPDLPTNPPSHVLLPESAFADFKYSYFFALGKHEQPTNSWMPTKDQIRDLEFHLPKISSIRPYNSDKLPKIQDPAGYNIQFVGVEMGGTRLIYANAACDLELESGSNWNSHLYIVADGWTCFWHAFYNPFTQQFSDLEINGRA
jgi:hypothetical protein